MISQFVPMEGAGEHTSRVVAVGEQETWGTHVDDDSPEPDVTVLRAALDIPRLERWSRAVFDLPDELQLFLLLSRPQMVMLHARSALIKDGVLPALVRGDSFAYRVKRANPMWGLRVRRVRARADRRGPGRGVSPGGSPGNVR